MWIYFLPNAWVVYVFSRKNYIGSFFYYRLWSEQNFFFQSRIADFFVVFRHSIRKTKIRTDFKFQKEKTKRNLWEKIRFRQERSLMFVVFLRLSGLRIAGNQRPFQNGSMFVKRRRARSLKRKFYGFRAPALTVKDEFPNRRRRFF